jgi:hypothetical protein
LRNRDRRGAGWKECRPCQNGLTGVAGHWLGGKCRGAGSLCCAILPRPCRACQHGNDFSFRRASCTRRDALCGDMWNKYRAATMRTSYDETPFHLTCQHP